MPAYEIECAKHGRYHHDAPIAEGPRKTCPSCGGPVATVLHAVPIHGVGGTAARRKWHGEREKDTEAYRRLRRDGVQPKGVTGAAEIEQRAGTVHEVERDAVWDNRKDAAKAQRAADELAK